MDNAQFSKSFKFVLHKYTKYHHTDNRAGLPYNFIARMKQGSVKFVLKQCTLTFHEGDVFFIPINIPYQSYWYAGKEDIVEFDSIGFGLFPDTSKKQYHLQKLNFNTVQQDMLDQITINYSVDCYSISVLYSLLSSLLNTMTYNAFSKEEQIIYSAKEFMRSNNDFSVSDIAKYCNISTSSLYNIFNKVCGYTPIHEKHKILIAKAIDILTTTDISITDLTEQLGFSSDTYFRKVFREVTGKTPREIRKESMLRI